MNETQEQLRNVEITIEEAKDAIKRKDMLVRLEHNPDFKELIADGFMKTHAIRQVMLKSVPGLSSPEEQKVFDDQITAIGQFKQYLVAIFTAGMNAEQALAADEVTREELLKEDLEGDLN